VPGAPLLDRLYERWVAIADRAGERRALIWAAGIPAVVLVLGAINKFVLLDFPNSGDEYVYLYQAWTMAAGRLWNAPVEPAASFVFSYVVQEPGRVFGSFPVGWPLALAAGLRIGLPVWLVSPAFGVLSLALVWRLGARLYSPRVGVTAAVLVAVSPFFLFNGASYFSHTFFGAMLLGGACLAARDDRDRPWVPVAAGLLVGWAVLARYFTGVVCAIPVAVWLLRPGAPRVRTAILFAVGGLPWVALLAWYNVQLSGSPWHLTTRPMTVSLWFADRWWLRGADMLATHIVRHLTWTPPALLAAYVVYLRTAPRETRRGLFDWMLVLVAGGLYAYIERGGNQYGPRFHYEPFLFISVFVAANLVRSPSLGGRSTGERFLVGLMGASVLAMPLSFAVHAVIERRVIVERRDVYDLTSDAGLDRALVLIDGRVGTTRPMAARDLSRNGITHDGAVLYGVALSPAENCAASAAHRDRTTYVYRRDRAASRGTLAPLVCP
jgi:hypothetical protein